MASHPASSLPFTTSEDQNFARDLIEKHNLQPESDRKTAETILLIQAVTNLQGNNLDSEFEKLKGLLEKYHALVADISSAAAN